MCLAGAVVACWSLTQEVAGSSSLGVHLGKTPMLISQADSLLGDMMSIHCYCFKYTNAILVSNTARKMTS